MDSSTLAARLRRTDDTVRAVAAVALLGLLARLVLLGQRAAHYDEGRVAYWALNYHETGAIHYRYIVHGPLAQYVDAYAFALLGPTDFAMRLFVALVGGLLPVAVLLYRRHLRDTELVVAAALLAFNPLLLYYSRFYRSSVLVAAFAFAALGFALRARDDGRPLLLYPAFGALALAFAAKENAVVYVLCWLGAGALVLDTWLMHPETDESGTAALGRRLRPYLRLLFGPDRSTDAWIWTGLTAGGVLVFGYAVSASWWLAAAVAALVAYVSFVVLLDVVVPERNPVRWGGTVLGGVVLFFAVTLFFYAPRDPGAGVGLWDAVGNPALWPELRARTVEDVRQGVEYWFGGSMEPKCGEETIVGGYVCFLEHTVDVLANYAVVTVAFGAVGFLAERYAAGRTRALVMFASYWGFVSVLGYPLGTDIRAGWIMVNAVVPLAIPAAVALGLVVRWGRESLAEEDHVGTALTVALLVLVAGTVLVPAVSASFVQPTADENGLVQYAQPQQEFRESFDDLVAIAPSHEGTDLLVHGSELVAEPGTGGGMAPACLRLQQGLPIHWYVAAGNATTECSYDSESLETRLAEGDPAVVVAHVDREETVADAVGDGYIRRHHHLRTMGREVVVFIDEDALAAAEGA